MVSLSEYEKRILLALKSRPRQAREELIAATKLDAATADHASAWLSTKGLVAISEKKREIVSLGDEGKRFLREGLPERQVLKLIGGGGKKVAELGATVRSANIAFGWLSKAGLAKIAGGTVVITDRGKQYLKEKMPQEKVLELLGAGKEVPGELNAELDSLKKRGNALRVKEAAERTIELTAAGKKEVEKGITVEHEVSQLTPELIVTKKWRGAKFREYDVAAPVQRLYPGKRHFVNEAMDYVRRIWLDMGFREMRGPLIDTSFWVFDTLFVPQEHPAREMQDTIFVNGAGSLPKGSLVEKVKKAHETGSRDSLGWGYKWNEETAKKLVLRTHTTVLSAHTLAELKKADWPAKYFSVGRCFRNEALEQTHLFEFNQVEGIVVDENANFRHLIGYLKEFFGKLGFEKARFRPSYFPYTEPSMEIDVFHPVYRKWFELGGAGIFRPEVTEPLLGEPVPVLAWGPGFDRIIMDYYKIMDIRDLYRNDVKQLRETRKWLMI